MSIEGAGAQLSNLNYTVHDPYNGTIATGGDSLAQNLNVFYEVRKISQSLDDTLLIKLHSLVILRG